MESLIFEVSHMIKITLFSFPLSSLTRQSIKLSVVVAHLGFMLKIQFLLQES